MLLANTNVEAVKRELNPTRLKPRMVDAMENAQTTSSQIQ
jgi:hypothetical protein